MAAKPSKNSPLSAEDIAHFQDLLIKKRHQLLDNVVSMENETLKKENTDLSHMPLHMGDLGSDTFEQENALSLVDSERKLLAEIDLALGRIEAGNYGLCLGSGDPIRKARLEAIPWAKYSIAFAEKLEQGLVSEPDEFADQSDENAA
ncbi:TraR/DksA family transcriptional regulator [Planctomycetota bacterium]